MVLEMATQSDRKGKAILLEEIENELQEMGGDLGFVFFLLLWHGVIGSNKKMLFKGDDAFQAYQKAMQEKIKGSKGK